MLSDVMEDYLKAIYQLQRETDDRIKTSEIADELDVTSPTVTSMLDKLEDRELVDREKYRGVTLTDEGETVAWRSSAITGCSRPTSPSTSITTGRKSTRRPIDSNTTSARTSRRASRTPSANPSRPARLADSECRPRTPDTARG